MTQTSSYSYSPLKGTRDIRLLFIEAAVGNPDMLKCQIRHFNIDDAPPYRALSYEWGNKKLKHPLFLNNRRFNFKMGTNLWKALRQLRDHGICATCNDNKDTTLSYDIKWIWIDALCINQKIKSERSHQVRFMGRIYKSAIVVFAWLMSDLDETEGHWYYEEALENLGRTTPGRNLTVADMEKFERLFQLSYWERVWIIQEICLAKNIILLYGRASADWSALGCLRFLLNTDGTVASRERRDTSNSLSTQGISAMLFEDFLSQRLTDSRLSKSFLEVQKRIQTSQAFNLDLHRTDLHRTDLHRTDLHQTVNPRHTLANLIEAFRGSESRDPRDKIYALLGLAIDCQEDEMTVDYSKSLFEVYTDTIKLYHDSNARAGRASQHTVRFSQVLQLSMNLSYNMYVEAESYLSLDAETKSRGLIAIFGLYCGVISSFEQDPPYISWEEKERSRILNLINTGYCFAMCAQDATEEVSFNTSVSPTKDPENASLGRSGLGISAFYLDNKLIGFASEKAQVGDVVYRFLGCDVAIVLRPREHGYNIIGRALIKGLVLVEAVKLGSRTARTRNLYRRVPDWMEVWTPEQESYFYMDMATLQQITI